ncbi:hypothetical protein ACRAVF_03500 [Bradyrhizobium oligotrophicum S58]
MAKLYQSAAMKSARPSAGCEQRPLDRGVAMMSAPQVFNRRRRKDAHEERIADRD